MQLDDAINKRRAVRKFSSKKVKWEHILEAIDASSQAPFAGNINHLQFVIVTEKNKIYELAKQSQQSWISDSPCVVVVCADPSKVEKIYDSRGERYSHQQSGAAIQNFLLKLTDLGISSCWVGAYADELIKQALKIPGHICIEALIPIGYEAERTKKMKKARLETLLNWEQWGVSKKPVVWPFSDPETR